MLPILLCALAGFFLAAHLATLLICWVRCRPRARRTETTANWPAVTVVRPLCGIEAFSARTLAATFALDYPRFELLFCVADDTDPVIPLVEAAIAAHPDVAARLLVGNDRIGANPKLNNMVKGWRHAAYDWIAFIDSNVLVPRSFIHGLMATVREDTGVVSAPPCAIEPYGFGAGLECAFLNTHEARWQYVVDTLGHGFAQGKTLVYRKADLDGSGLRDLAAEPAEDAATTKMVRRSGRRIRLAPPSPLPLGVRSFRDMWGRQLRWARLRRATFPLEFFPEILCGSVIPALVTIAAAVALGWPVTPVILAYLTLWYASELSLAAGCGWPTGWQMPFAMVLRDVLLPALYIGAYTGKSFTWNGVLLSVEGPPRRRDTLDQAMAAVRAAWAGRRARSGDHTDLGVTGEPQEQTSHIVRR